MHLGRICAVFVLGTVLVVAQTAPTSPASASTSASKPTEDAIQLSAFEVTEASGSGYGFATSAPVSASVAGPTGPPLIDETLLSGGAGQNRIHAYSQVNTDTYEVGTSKTFKFGSISLDARLIGRYRKQLSDASRVRATPDNKYLDASGNLLNTGLDNRFTQLSTVQGRVAAIYRERFQYDHRPVWRRDHNYGLDLNFTLDPGRSERDFMRCEPRGGRGMSEKARDDKERETK